MNNFLKRPVALFSLLASVLLVLVGGFFINKQNSTPTIIEEAIAEEPYRLQTIPIGDNDTFGTLMNTAGIAYNDVSEIVEAAEDVYSLTKIRAGKELWLYFDKDTNEFTKLVYRIGTEDDLVVTRSPQAVDGNTEFETTSTDNGLQTSEIEYEWSAERVPIPYEVKIETAGATVDEILYVSALDKGIDELLVLDLANVLQWSIDFANEVRSGDSFKVIYEARYLDGKYVMPGKILAAEYNNAGTIHQAFYFEEDEDNKAYFDADGNSVQKQFLKAPVEYKYITSGFTTGARYISAFNISTGHRAIDYATPAGTPIRATADGVVTSAGWSRQGYGNLTTIRHNETYSTNYAHQSRIIVRAGQKVKQGDTIGYVGSTGLSTGPHLHYEMVKNGVKINPLTEILPPGKPIKDENRARFEALRNDLQAQLESINTEN